MGADRANRIGSEQIRRLIGFVSLVLAFAGAACGHGPALAQTPDAIRDVLSARRSSSDAAGFYELRAYRSVWFEGGRPTPSYAALARVVERLAEDGLDPLDYALPGGDRANAQADVQTTETALRLAHHLLRGRVDPRTMHSGWSLPRRDRPLSRALSSAVDAESLDDMFRALEPNYEGYRALKKSLASYRGVQARGGWPALEAVIVLHPGDTSSAVDALRRRLLAAGDITRPSPAGKDVYDEQLERAVKDFQEHHGLEVDGIVGRRTLEELNVPVANRIHTLKLNMERWRWMPEQKESAYVQINIPAFTMRVVDNGRTILQMKVIVGTPRTRTPVFSTRIEEVVLAPYWVVPRSIEVNEILPKLNRDPGYLRRNHIRRLPSGMLRQDPGPSNPLGRIKFAIPNAFGVGLHDTPQRELFGRAVCAFSHGCMRLERPEDLAVHLLSGTEWSRSRIREVIDRWKETRIRLEQPTPLHVLYFSAWVDDDGRSHFRNDIYGFDDRLTQSLGAR